MKVPVTLKFLRGEVPWILFLHKCPVQTAALLTHKSSLGRWLVLRECSRRESCSRPSLGVGKGRRKRNTDCQPRDLGPLQIVGSLEKVVTKRIRQARELGLRFKPKRLTSHTRLAMGKPQIKIALTS